MRLGACGGNLTSPIGLLTSPSYPNQYPENIECIYRITQDNVKSITIIFLDLDIHQDAYDGTCALARLEISGHARNGSTIICGYYAEPIQFRDSTLWLR